MTAEPIHIFSSVWDAIEETPEQAANMRLRADLMMALRAAVESWHLTQAQAATRLAITQPRLNDLLRGRITKFSLDTLATLAHRAGLSLRLEITRAAA
jgi:predicted XRE-type DNA-binding protein